MMRTHEFEIVTHHNTLNEVVGRLWWNGAKIESDDWRLLHKMKSMTIHHGGKALTYKDGPKFLEALPSHYKSGYTTVRKV